jgi:hypothetical protein
MIALSELVLAGLPDVVVAGIEAHSSWEGDAEGKKSAILELLAAADFRSVADARSTEETRSDGFIVGNEEG